MRKDYEQRKDVMSPKMIIIFIAVVLVPLIFSGIIRLITDILWFDSVHYLEVFLKVLYSKVGLFIPASIIFSLLIFIFINRLKNNYMKYFEDEISDSLEKMKRKILGASVLVGSLLGFNFAEYIWEDLLLFLNAQKFGQGDPIFNLDISFYVFKLPLIKTFLSVIIFLLILVTITLVVYFLIVYNKKKVRKQKVIDFQDYQKELSIKQILCSHSYQSLIRTIVTFVVTILILLGINYILLCYRLLYSSVGVIYGAGYTDIHITLRAYQILAGLSFLSTILVIIGYKKTSVKVAFSGIASIVAVQVISVIVAFVFQQLIVLPDEISKEGQYIDNNIQATQNAYNIQDIEFIDYKVENKLSIDVIKEEKEIIDNIKINDKRPLKQTYNQIQGIRSYYYFNDVDLDRYIIDGQYVQTFIAPRELDLARLTADSDTWLNRHFKYTHGYGAVLSPVSSVNDDGQPTLLIKDIPPISEKLEIKQPRIYFGEYTNDYIIVNSDEKEFDYPKGNDNVKYEYQGGAGVSLEGLNKLLYSIEKSSMKLFFSGNINDDSRIVYNRNIYRRLDKIAPFFEYDNDPYLVLNQENGKLYWIIDGYTSAANYPYAKPYRFKNKYINYLRNSLKVVIDPYEGTVNFYKFDDEPIVNTYSKIFPTLIKDKEEMPEGLKDHVKYPQDYFDLQAEVYQKYHVDNPEVFYNGEDIWEIGIEKYMEARERIRTKPNYVTFKLPGEIKTEFLLTIPFTPNRKANMSSLFIARNDLHNYGKLFIYKFPKDKLVKGISQIETEIDQDSYISERFTLWNQQGSNVLRGNVIIIPIRNSLLYVEPIYLKSDGANSLPEMKKVIIFYNERIVMEDNLDEAINVMFDGDINEEIEIIDTEGQTNLSEEQQKILDEINDLLEKQKKDLEKIEELIDRFNNLNN